MNREPGMSPADAEILINTGEALQELLVQVHAEYASHSPSAKRIIGEAAVTTGLGILLASGESLDDALAFMTELVERQKKARAREILGGGLTS